MILLFSWLVWQLPADTTIETEWGDTPANRIRMVATISQRDIRLSEEITLTLTIEGPSPLEVTRPKPLLRVTALWRVFEDAFPLREILPNARQRWKHVYRLSPLVPGDAVAVPITAISVRTNRVEPVMLEFQKVLHVRVTTRIMQPTLEELRPVTPIEPLATTAPPVEQPRTRRRDMIIFGVSLGLVLAGGVWWYYRKPRPQVNPATWAKHALQQATTIERMTWIIIEFLERQCHIHGYSKTSAELLQAINPPFQEPLRALLVQADQARYAGVAINQDAFRAETIAFIDALSQAMNSLPQSSEQQP